MGNLLKVSGSFTIKSIVTNDGVLPVGGVNDGKLF